MRRFLVDCDRIVTNVEKMTHPAPARTDDDNLFLDDDNLFLDDLFDEEED